ncbi:MAG: YicC/YloC family endoribonuclease [Tenacibaculum sp.]
MIHSMTGYGKSTLQLATKKITIEIKSLNSKIFDLNTRIPAYYKEKELDIRKKLANSLVRGKIEFSIFLEDTVDQTPTTLNKRVIQEYMKQLNSLVHSSSNNIDLLAMAVKMPDALKIEKEEFDEQEWLQIESCLDKAIDEIIQYRLYEASSIEQDFKDRINNIKSGIKDIEKLDTSRINHIKPRLRKALEDLKIEIDENRFEQELIYYLEKIDINEEKVRLANHLDYFLEQLASENSNGKKLGFIAQEIGREINTTGSKANFAPMQKVVIEMKDELEKIKEQVLNVL